MDKIRAEKWQQLIDLLHEADAIQQELLGDVDERACYEFHSQLNNIADEFECFAAEEEQSAEIG
jgi:hypothetical protein